ncbi:hypothetical protein Baya_6672 [Bagarius yarrelli]|uniref:Uncharacterized protein n=1 Tax=Bagarius yarrelli TaxID=175774 RepID=A0A556U1I7_BAGYA|nr:hypothetical protein Baya_6672 [Bagarius yarrelli]
MHVNLSENQSLTAERSTFPANSHTCRRSGFLRNPTSISGNFLPLHSSRKIKNKKIKELTQAASLLQTDGAYQPLTSGNHAKIHCVRKPNVSSQNGESGND